MSYPYNNRRRSNWLDQPSGYSDINLGFGVHQQKQYERPKIQLLTKREPPIEQQRKLCVKCQDSLNWLVEQRRFICYSCGVTFHEQYSNTLPNSNDNTIKPLQSVDPYESVGPAIISKRIDRRLQGERNNASTAEITSISGNGRKARIHVKGSPAQVTEEWIRKQLQEDWAYGY